MSFVPDVFIKDVQAKDTHIFPKIVIHTQGSGFGFSSVNYNLYFSTKKLIFQGVDNESNKEVYWKPLLLELPKVKEKYDVDTKQSVVSKITISLSNVFFEGARFTDIMSQIGFVGKNVTVYYQTQSAESNDDCLKLFYGKIKRVTHDAKTVKLEVHDLGAGLHKDLPQTYLDNLEGPSAGKPIPINYGTNEYAPAVLQSAGTHYKVWFDTVRCYSGLQNPWETSGKLTKTANFKGFAKSVGYQNPVITWGHGIIHMFINGQYPEIRIATYKTRLADNSAFDGKGLSQSEYDSFAHAEIQHNYPTGDYEPSEPWVKEDEPYFKIFKTEQMIADNSISVTHAYKPDNVSLSIIKANQDNSYPSAMEDIVSTLDVSLLEKVSDGVYWESGGGYETIDNVLPPFYTSDPNGDDIPPENFTRPIVGGLFGTESYVYDSEFRVKLVEFVIGTDPGLDQKRLQYVYCYINGLRIFTVNDPNICLEWNNVSQTSPSGIQWPNSYASIIGQDDDGDDIYTYWNQTLQTRGSIQNAADAGHYGTNIPDNGNLGAHPSGDYSYDDQLVTTAQHTMSPAYYPREIFGMHGWWTYDSNHPGWDGTNWGDDLSGSTIRFNTNSWPNQQPSFPPAFDFGCRSVSHTDADVGHHYTRGVVRLWSSATVSNDIKMEWFQAFRDDDFDGDTHPNPQINALVDDIDGYANSTRWTAKLRQIDLSTIAHIENPQKKDWAVNVRGRVYDGYDEHQGGWSYGRWLQNPADIIRSLVEVELGFYDFDEDDYQLAYNEHTDWRFSLSVFDTRNSKDVIEDMAQYTKMFPKFSIDGKFRFNTIKKSYGEDDFDGAISIEYEDLIDYKFELTKIEDICSSVDLYYRHDYYNDAYSKRWADVCSYGHVSEGGNPLAGQIEPAGMVTSGYDYTNGHRVGGVDYDGVAGGPGCLLPQMSDAQLEFYGIEDIRNNIKKLECKYFTDWTENTSYGESILKGPGDGSLIAGRSEYYSRFGNYTAHKVHDYWYYQFNSQHLVFKLKLPVKYVWIDVGRLIKIEKLFNGMPSYGINYTKMENHAGAIRYPLFFVTGVSKSTSHIEVTCMQLHYLGPQAGLDSMSFTHYDDYLYWANFTGGEEPTDTSIIHPPFTPGSDYGSGIAIYGCTDPMASNYDPNATVSTDTCEYIVTGCMDPNAANYNSDAVMDDGSCEYIAGCTDPVATNYNPDAIIGDGSCVYDWGDLTTIQFGGIHSEVDGDIFFNKSKQSYQYTDFTTGGAFGYGDLQNIDEAYSDFQGLVFPVGRNDDGTPNDAFNWIFGFDGQPQRWKVNGQPIGSLQDLLFDGETTIDEIQYPDGVALITVTIGPREQDWESNSLVLWNLEGWNEWPLNGLQQSYIGGILEEEVYIGYFKHWYGKYEWRLVIHWQDGNYSLDWELSDIDGLTATNVWCDFPYLTAWGTGNNSDDVEWASYHGIYIDVSSQSFDDPSLLGFGLNPDTAFIVNEHWESQDEILDSFPVLVDKNSLSIPNFFDEGVMLFSLGETMNTNDLGFMATEITIEFHDTLIQKTPNEPERYLEFTTLWTPEFTEPTTQVYEGSSAGGVADNPGDINLSGDINIQDLVVIVNYIMGIEDVEDLSDEAFLNADMNDDGDLNLLDVISIVNQMLEDA